MAVKIQIKNYNSTKQLCRSCKYSRIRRGYGFVCGFTAETPSYYGHCPNFKLLKYRDDKIHRIVHEYQKKILGLISAILFTASFILINYFVTFEFSLVVLMLFLLIYAIYYANKPMMVNSFGWFSYVYLVLAGYASKQKAKSSDLELRIIQTQVLKMMGWTAIEQANKVLKNKTDSLEDIQSYVSKLSVEESLIAFSLVCEVYVYYNLDDFLTSETIKKIAFLLKLKTEDYIKIKKKYELRELNHQQKNTEQERKEKYEKESREKRKSYQIFNINRKNYYSVLGLQKNASISAIKTKFRELAVKYHPDKHVGNSDEQKKATEKFKKISEAYNHFRRQKGF